MSLHFLLIISLYFLSYSFPLLFLYFPFSCFSFLFFPSSNTLLWGLEPRIAPVWSGAASTPGKEGSCAIEVRFRNVLAQKVLFKQLNGSFAYFFRPHCEWTKMKINRRRTVKLLGIAPELFFFFFSLSLSLSLSPSFLHSTSGLGGFKGKHNILYEELNRTEPSKIKNPSRKLAYFISGGCSYMQKVWRTWFWGLYNYGVNI